MDELLIALRRFLANSGVCHADRCTYARKAVCSCGLSALRAAIKKLDAEKQA